MSEFLWHAFIEPLHDQALQKALIGGTLVAIVCGVIGCLIILRRMAFLGDAISHSMLAGVTAGYLFMKIVFDSEAHAIAMLIGSLIAGIVTVGTISFVSRVSRVKEDTAIGIMYTGIFAAGGILASIFSDRIHIDLYHFVVGMVLAVRDANLWMMAFVAAFVLTVVILFFRHFQITTFDPVMAASIGIPVVTFEYLLTTCTSLVVISAVNIVGIILVVGLLVTPAATAYLICDRLHRMMVTAALFGVSAVFGGLYVSYWFGNFATGPTIVVFSTLQFLTVLVVAPRYGMIAGWWRRRLAVPQQIVEDVLGCFRYADKGRMTLPEIAKAIHQRTDLTRKAVRHLLRSDMLERDGNGYRLTVNGKREAKRILRAHRLWETYLQHVGIPKEQLHKRAHVMEHVHDERTVDYLDDKLGHPIVDPHGAEIPEDFVHVVPGATVKASLLRDGRTGTIVSIEPTLKRFGLKVGDRIVAGPRAENDQVWTFHLPDGRKIELSHDEADLIQVTVSPSE